MLTSGKPKRARQRAVLPETFDLRLDQNEIFEIDRANLVLQLRSIQRAIDESAEEMEMVALERVFVKSVSQALTRTSRKLYAIAKDLNGLHRIIERAHLPKERGRSNRKPRRRPRRKRQN
jgi:hypothetical protein